MAGTSLLQFVRRCAEHFLNSEQQEVRLEAVRTCSRLLRLAVEGTCSEESETVRTTVSEVLNRLLVVGITDTGTQTVVHREGGRERVGASNSYGSLQWSLKKSCYQFDPD